MYLTLVESTYINNNVTYMTDHHIHDDHLSRGFM